MLKVYQFICAGNSKYKAWSENQKVNKSILSKIEKIIIIMYQKSTDFIT